MDETDGCLADELKRLKESSKEAVENLKSFSTFKKYMHEEREVQGKLVELLKNAKVLNKSQLILVCGSTGDGKSHLISYLNETKPDLMENFNEHNDATESFEPLKTSIDTLNDVLDHFSDEKLHSNETEKLVLAINLGALNNFIDSEYGDRFSKLRKYVMDKKILDSNIEDNLFDEESYFQFINFSDYHMYSITENGVKSDYIFNLLKKIVKNDDNNVFYKSFSRNCSKCMCNYKCPVKANYEFLMDERVQNIIVDILIEVTIKEKLIISTRALLNFFYDIIADSYIDGMEGLEAKKLISKISFDKYIRLLTPNILYDHEDLSNILCNIKKNDPINIRTEEIDDIIVKLNTINDISEVFIENIEFTNEGYLKDVIFNKIELNDYIKDDKELKQYLIIFFFRLYKFKSKAHNIDLSDHVYLSYVENLYYWNKGVKNKLIDLYEGVAKAIYKWNGECEQGNINLFIGRNQLDYRISENLNISPYIDNLKEIRDEQLNRFIPSLIVGYKKQNTGEVKIIDIDYSLYKFLEQVRNGYRPNKNDKNNYINFVDFVDSIIQMGDQNVELYFEDKQNFSKRYKLIYKKEFEQFSFMEM